MLCYLTWNDTLDIDNDDNPAYLPIYYLSQTESSRRSDHH
jgi:hypothetical protein